MLLTCLFLCSLTSTNSHLSTPAIFLADSPYIHSCLTLSTTATSLHQPFFLADSPYIHACFNLFTTATSLHQPFFWQTVLTFTLVSTFLQQPPLYTSHFFGRQSLHSRLFQPFYNSHLSTMATSLQWPFLGGRQSIHWLLFQPLYNGHFLLSPRWPLWRGSTLLCNAKSWIPLVLSCIRSVFCFRKKKDVIPLCTL